MAKYFWDLDAAFGSNTDVAGQSTQGSANANTIDTIFQKLLAVLGVFGDQLGGIGTVAGTADAITLTSSGTYPIQSLANGVVLAFKAGSANTGAATINVDSLGAKAIRRQGDSALSANDIVANGVYLIRYDTAYNAAAGAWVLLNPTVSSSLTNASTTEQLTGTDATKYATADSVAALWEKGSDIASAGTISIGEGGYFHVTGTTTITDIDFGTATNGRAAILIFDGALTLTHNATTLLLPGAANITTVAGDRCMVVQDSSDNVTVVWYQRANGTAVVAGGLTLLDTITATSGTTATSAQLTSYPTYIIKFEGISFSAAVALTLELSSTNGAAWGASVNISQAMASAANTLSGVIEIFLADSTNTRKVARSTIVETTIDKSVAAVGPVTNTGAAVDKLRFGGGTFDGASGYFKVYGMP